MRALDRMAAVLVAAAFVGAMAAAVLQPAGDGAARGRTVVVARRK